jgi:DNA-binding response OmpR family regulator
LEGGIIIARLAGDLERDFSAAAAERRIALSFGIDPSVPLTTDASHERVAHLLRALLWNAIEEAHAQIRLAVDLTADDRITFSIECSGIQLAEVQRLSQAGDLASAAGVELDVAHADHGTVRLLLPRPSPAGPEPSNKLLRPILVIQRNRLLGHHFAEAARASSVRAVLTSRAEKGLSMARLLRPKAIILDTAMTDADGWVLLDLLKRDAETAHIPVLALCSPHEGRRARSFGAFDHLPPPRSDVDVAIAVETSLRFSKRARRRVLVVAGTLDWPGIDIDTARDGADALESITAHPPDCVIIPPMLDDMSGNYFVDRLRRSGARVPVIVRADRASIDIDADVVIEDGPIGEASLTAAVVRFLHLPEASLSPAQRKMLEEVRAHDPILAGRKMLIVDDDVFTLFELTGLLERHRVDVRHCESGRDALALLGAHAVDLVLMDIVMPEMDGLQTIRQIRSNPRLAQLPILAVTGRTAPGSREEALNGGATDYVPKPIDADRLVAHIRTALAKYAAL